jgi:putative endonuclease
LLEHREQTNPKSFTGRYNVSRLIYYESCLSVEEAVERERYIKGDEEVERGLDCY